MHQPLLKPCCLQGSRRYTPQTVYNVATAKSDEPFLYFRLFVRIACAVERILIKNGIRILIQENQRRVQKKPEKKIVMDPFSQVAATSNVSRLLIKHIITPGWHSGLNLQPFAITVHVIKYRELAWR